MSVTDVLCEPPAPAPAAAAAYIPDGVEDVERVVELGLLWVVLDGEEACIAEVDPCDKPQSQDAVARWTLVDVQYQTRVKELFTTNMVNQLRVELLILYNQYKTGNCSDKQHRYKLGVPTLSSLPSHGGIRALSNTVTLGTT